MQAIQIIALSVVAAILYGIVYDMITVHVCIEYFTEWHPPIFGGTRSPMLLALGWGVIATWWVGLPLGCILALAARVGGLPQLSAANLVRPLAVMLTLMLAAAMLAGWYASTHVGVPSRIAADVLPERQARFMFDAGAHLASYAMGVLAGLALAGFVIWRRLQVSKSVGRNLSDAWADRSANH